MNLRDVGWEVVGLHFNCELTKEGFQQTRFKPLFSLHHFSKYTSTYTMTNWNTKLWSRDRKFSIMMISRMIMSDQKRLYEFGIRYHVINVTITCFRRESKFWKALKYRICWFYNNETGMKTSKTKSPFLSDGPWTHYQKAERWT